MAENQEPPKPGIDISMEKRIVTFAVRKSPLDILPTVLPIPFALLKRVTGEIIAQEGMAELAGIASKG